MKIQIVCPRLCHGGAERVAVTLANGFVEKGHQVSFITDFYEEQTYTLNDSIKVYNLVSATKSKVLKWLSAVWNVRKSIKRERPDAIIGIMETCSLVSRIASINTGIPVIATEHNSFEWPDSDPMPSIRKFYKHYVCKVYRVVTVLTDADKKAIGSRLKNAVVMPNPLAISPIEKVPSKTHIVLAAGRVDNWCTKGFDVLIKAWGVIMNNEEFKKEYSGWRLQIAGAWRGDNTLTYLNDLAKECGVEDQIDYLGFISDIQSLYQKASIFVLSSRYEGFGLVLIEAMSQGCACIACDYKGRQREIMSPTPAFPCREGEIEVCENGILCEPDDVEALAEGIKRMMEDEEYRKRVQRNSIERSKAYSVDQTIQRWEQLLNQLVH